MVSVSTEQGLYLTHITVVNALGQVVFHQSIDLQNKAEINTEKLPSGNYIIQIHTDKGRVQHQLQIIK